LALTKPNANSQLLIDISFHLQVMSFLEIIGAVTLVLLLTFVLHYALGLWERRDMEAAQSKGQQLDEHGAVQCAHCSKWTSRCIHCGERLRWQNPYGYMERLADKQLTEMSGSDLNTLWIKKWA
jgi:hypothetical protein